MILLDPRVISEPLRSAPAQCVIDWIDAQPLETMFLAAVSVAELRAGVAMLPIAARRAQLQEHLEKRVIPLFVGRVLAFDVACTHAYADLMAKAQAAHSGLTTADGLIAAVAQANGFALATPTPERFDAVGVLTINPWSARAS